MEKNMNELDTKQIKETAWKKLGGKWAPACLGLILYFLVAVLISSPAFFFEEGSVAATSWTWIDYMLSWILGIGIVAYFYDLARGCGLSYKRIFTGFSNGFIYAINVFVTQLLTGIFVFLWALLLIVPGIMRAFSYSMVLFILVDHPEYSPLEAIRKSKEMMYGHRMELFVLELRFIPWVLLGIITLGIGFIWVTPYFMTAYSEFYLQLKEKSEPSITKATEVEATEVETNNA